MINSAEMASLMRALRRFDMITPDSVIAWAESCWLAGDDNPAIVALATMSDWRASEVDTALDDYLEVLRVPSENTAASGHRIVAATVADIMSGKVSEIDGARVIRRIYRHSPDVFHSLLEFRAFADEWEESPTERHYYEQQIRISCEDYVNTTNPSEHPNDS